MSLRGGTSGRDRLSRTSAGLPPFAERSSYAGGAVSARARRGMVLTYHPTVWLARLTVVVASLLIARLILKMMPGNF